MAKRKSKQKRSSKKRVSKQKRSSKKTRKNTQTKKTTKPTSLVKTSILCIVLSVFISALITYSFVEFKLSEKPSREELIKDFYDVETATHVSPHHIRKHIHDGTEILVDLRSQEEYEQEHIIGAINIPAYKDKDHSDYGAVNRIVSEFSKLPTDRDIIVYCYSTPCMTGRKVGKILADHGIYVKHLGIGWNEWRYDWTSWNHAHEWNSTNVEDYIQSGPSPGVAKLGLKAPACSANRDAIGC